MLNSRYRRQSVDIVTSETVASWPIPARYAWNLMPLYLDDYGRGQDNPKIIASSLFPLDDDIDGKVLEQWLNMFADAGSLCRYEVDGKRLLHAPKWSDHQKPQHPGKAKIAPCPTHESATLRAFLGSPSVGSHEDLRRVSPTGGEGKGRDGKGREGAAPEPHGSAQHCPKHRHDKNPPACGACKEARIWWERQQLDAKPDLRVVLDDLRRTL